MTDFPQSPGQWPSVSASWRVAGTYPAPQLVLNFAFDATRYTSKDGAADAADAGAVYCDLIARLTETEGAALSISSSLSSSPIAVTAANLAAITTWFTSITQYLANIAAGRPATPPSSPLAGSDGSGLAFALSPAALPAQQMFELTCGFAVALDASTPATAAQPAIGNAGLGAFAADLEAAYAAPAALLKVAAGPSPFGADLSASSRLWAVQAEVPASAGPLVFSPKPISRQLVSYTSGTQSFTNVDLDQWVSELFGAVDDLLGDRYIDGLTILDTQAPGTLAALQKHKRSLAAMFAQQMSVVFTDQTAPDDSVVSLFERTMYERLSNGYLTRAALQYTAVGDTGALDGRHAPIVLVTSPGQPGEGTGQFVLLSGNGGYGAPKWLRLVRAGDGFGGTKIPLVTRAHPASPIMASHSGASTTSQPATLSEAMEWTYAFTCSRAAREPHDVMTLSVVFNQIPQPDVPMGIADSIAALAEFATMRPQIQRDLDAALAALTTSAPQAQLDSALAAVQSFTKLLERIASPRRFVAPAASRAYVSATSNNYTCTLQETTAREAAPPVVLPELDPDALIVTVAVPEGGGPVPRVDLSGTQYVTVNAGPPAVAPATKSTTQQYYFVDKAKPVPFAAAESFGPRTISYPGLPILGLHDAQASVFVTRNQDLVPGRTTREEFIYQTAEATFPAPVRPALEQAASINVGAIASPNVTAAPRPLADNLTALFYTLIGGAASTSALLEVAVKYQYPMAGLMVGVPVLMQPAAEVSWATGNDTLAPMITNLSEAIGLWFERSMPAGGGQLQIALTVSRADGEPLVRLTSLDLALSDIKPPLATMKAN